MIRRRNRLTFLHDANGSFTDYTEKAAEFRDQLFSVSYTDATDYIYIGYYKPVNSIYFEMQDDTVTEGRLSAEYYDGAAWQPLDASRGFIDETLGLHRSGFVRWDRYNDNGTVDENEVTIDGRELFFYRFKLGADATANIDGVALVFADDRDIKKAAFELASCLPEGEASHILTHVLVRDEIVQEIRNNGNRKLKIRNGRLADIEAVDLHDIEQINLAATYYACHMIYMAISDLPDDSYMNKSEKFKVKYNSAMQLFYLSLDTDDDGSQDIEEELGDSTTLLVRR